MKVLIACECSGVVREAFRAKGHDAWSCDLLPATDGSEFHVYGDVLKHREGGFPVLSWKWDMMIAHPPCDYLTNSAAWAYKDPDFERYPGVGYHQKLKPGTLFGAARRKAREDAKTFFLALWNVPIARICIENPIGCMNTHPDLPRALPARQIVQPHQFGEDASKATCLWLKGLPPLRRTLDFPPRLVQWEGKTVKRWSNQTDSGQNKLTPTDDRASVRAVTYSGIATAMAEQWGKHALALANF